MPAPNVRAQISTRAGRPGQQGVAPIAHGDYDMSSRGDVAKMRSQLSELMSAAADAARGGFVTEVAVMVYRADAPELANNNNPRL